MYYRSRPINPWNYINFFQEIQLLTQPPQNEEIVKKKKVKEKDVGLPVYRRGGKTVNREFCNSCKEGGDLLCCDRCPAAFHLECQ